MRKEHLEYLVCPSCKEALICIEILKQTDNSIETGTLQCSDCGEKYNIIHHIPRFVSIENYASGFGLEWTKHAKTQYDSYTKTNISRTRFFNETKWSEDLSGQIILEVGSGSGRFTEQAASTGAMVVSMDYSYAVEANYASNGNKDNVFIVQGDIFKMPFRENFFDKLFCFGVLQHVPKVEEAFKKLPHYLKSGGALAIDVYRKPEGLQRILNTKYLVRPITRKISPEKLYRLCKGYIEFMWPIARIINKIPYRGRRLNWILLICDYRGYYPLSEEILKEWAILDTFDMLAPAYDFPQTIETVQRWFKKTNLINVDIQYGYNGIEGRGTKP
jgi:SAM-dependent methyltransferase